MPSPEQRWILAVTDREANIFIKPADKADLTHLHAFDNDRGRFMVRELHPHEGAGALQHSHSGFHPTSEAAPPPRPTRQEAEMFLSRLGEWLHNAHLSAAYASLLIVAAPDVLARFSKSLSQQVRGVMTVVTEDDVRINLNSSPPAQGGFPVA